jgi:small subunit ribosomal protein S5
MVVNGDGARRLGFSRGRAKAVPDAVRKGTTNARKQMETVVMNGTTIPHEVTATFGASKVFLRPASAGTGVIAGGGVRAVVEAAGIKDVLSKTFGSSNTINIIGATMKALRSLRDPGLALARRRGEPAPDSAQT